MIEAWLKLAGIHIRYQTKSPYSLATGYSACHRSPVETTVLRLCTTIAFGQPIVSWLCFRGASQFFLFFFLIFGSSVHELKYSGGYGRLVICAVICCGVTGNSACCWSTAELAVLYLCTLISVRHTRRAQISDLNIEIYLSRHPVHEWSTVRAVEG